MEQRHRSSPYRPFAISIERSRDEVAVVPVGELDLASADRLGQEVRQLRAAGCAQIVLDLRQVDFIDSTGLRILLTCATMPGERWHEQGPPQLKRGRSAQVSNRGA
jgi:ABC-type transporter Mla MlaB component